MIKLRTIIIIISFILAFGLLGNYYIQSNKIVSPEIVYLNADNMDNFTGNWIEKMGTEDDMVLIKNWITKQGSTSSMVLGKVTRAGKAEEYYLYLNNIKTIDVGISPHTYDGIRIQVKISDNTNKKSQVFRIKPTDKKLKYIILNDNKFEVPSIAEIN